MPQILIMFICQGCVKIDDHILILVYKKIQNEWLIELKEYFSKYHNPIRTKEVICEDYYHGLNQLRQEMKKCFLDAV